MWLSRKNVKKKKMQPNTKKMCNVDEKAKDQPNLRGVKLKHLQ